jgi:hypothetical protein
VLEPALGEGRDEELQGDARVDFGAYGALVLSGAQALDVELERGFEELGHEHGSELFVDDTLGGQGAGRRLEPGVEQFVDGGAQHEPEVGREVAGVREPKGRLPLLRRQLRGLLAQIEKGFEEYVGLGRPPAVDRLLADSGAGGDALDGGLGVTDLADEGEGGVVDGASGSLAAAGGVGGGLLRGLGGLLDHAPNLPA